MLLTAGIVAFPQGGDLKKQTYFRLGFSIPSWKYRGYESKESWEEGYNKKTGAIIEAGTIFMLNSIKLAPGMRIGINVDYLSVNYHRFGFQDEDASENYIYIGSKVGPSFSFCPVQRLVFDAYAKINPVWVAGGLMYYHSELFDDEVYVGFMGIRYSLGLNVRYSILMLGVEFNPGFAKLRYWDSEEKELTDEYLGNANDNKDKTPVPGVNFTVGLSF